MKVGILTFHRATNYGAILQAYALLKFLQTQGHDVKIIDYKPKGMSSLYAPINVPGIKNKIKRIVLNLLMLPSLKSRCLRRKMFWDYINTFLPLTERIYASSSLPAMDAFIVGSDQVWSTCFTGGIDPLYWGQFDRKRARLISYAGSAAEDMENSFYTNDNAKLLKTFDYISVRERELKQYLQKQSLGKDIVQVTDPTLMAGAELFHDLIANKSPLSKPYLLIYQVIRTKDAFIQEYAKQIASCKEWDIVEIKNTRLYIWSKNKLSVSKNLQNPSDFVNLFKYAQYVITTSFHGTAFALMFNRPFNVVSISEEVDSRAKNILGQLNLNDRLITLPSVKEQKEIDWGLINQKLAELRIPSRMFLQKALTQ
ncbi:MAG: polysaccharide pyruvyl transferase family protein [Alloprevotella sp.]|nr:polysaccharide pyruvyl transferase family protein [Alloprevotella sp.]